MLRAQLALQGIAPRPRMQLLACALAALEQQVGRLAQHRGRCAHMPSRMPQCRKLHSMQGTATKDLHLQVIRKGGLERVHAKSFGGQ